MNASVGVPSALLLDGALAAALIPVCVFSAYVGYIIYHITGFSTKAVVGRAGIGRAVAITLVCLGNRDHKANKC